MELQKPKSENIGLVKEETYAEKKLKKLFSELKNKYKIDIDPVDEKEKLKYVKNLNKEEYKAYERELIQIIRKSDEYKKIEDYNKKFKNLKELYKNYRGSSEYINLIRELENNHIDYIEEQLLKLIKKRLDRVAESFIDSQYSKYRNRDDRRVREKIILAKKSEIKNEIDNWTNSRFYNGKKYVYFFPTSDNRQSFKEMFEEAILNASD